MSYGYETVKQFDEVYDSLASLPKFNSPAKWAVVAKVFDLSHLKVITPYDVRQDSSYISNFIRSVGPSVMYPLTFGQVVFGYAFRSLADKNFILLSYSPLAIYSSLRTMLSPMKGEMFVYGTILVISEGVLDAEALSMAWPFSYACLTNHVNDYQAQLISMFTNKVVYFKDNDKPNSQGIIPGDEGARITKKNLQKYDVTCHISRMGQEYKDPGELIEGIAVNGYLPKYSMVVDQLVQEIQSYQRA